MDQPSSGHCLHLQFSQLHVFLQLLLSSNPVQTSARSILQDAQSSSSKQCPWVFLKRSVFSSLIYRLLQDLQPSNILNHQVANNVFPSIALRLLEDPQSSKILTNQIASNATVSLTHLIVQTSPRSSNSNQGYFAFFKLPLSSNLVPAPPRSLIQTPHILPSRPSSSKIQDPHYFKIITPPRSSIIK